LPEIPEGEVKGVTDRLRELAERLPPGGSLTLTRDALLDLAAAKSGDRSDHANAPPELTVPELAGRFHRSPSTIRDWCEQGRFEGAFKLNGRDWRIPQAAVDAFLARQGRQPRTSPVNLSAWRVMRRTE
jgi:excisionase family DNA binding protein